jgi:zinc protease
MPVAAVSDKSFGREVLVAAMPVLVVFSAEHAPFNPVLDELPSELAGKLKVARVDVVRNPELKDAYGVRGLPTLILFKYGKPVARRVGSLLSKAELQEWIDGALILALATRRTSVSRPATDFKMANGMKVVVIPDHRVPVVTLMVWYRVGSANDPKDYAGIARLLEHVTFRSLDKFTGGNFAKAVSRIGGETNATGYKDATVFWQRLPKERLRTGLEWEVDRMVNLRLDDDDVTAERGTILEQRRSAMMNDPGARLAEEMEATFYRAHPYALPSSGLPNALAQLTRDDLLRFHKLHYAPNKALLVVSGDVTSEDVKQLAHETFGRISAENAAEPLRPEAPPQVAARRVALEDTCTETARFHRTYAVPSYATAAPGEAAALDVLTKILAGGIASRLYRKLVIESKVASSVSGLYLADMADTGELRVVVLATDSALSAVEVLVDEVIDEIRRSGVQQDELASAKRFLIANYAYDGADQINLAYRHGWAAVLGLAVEEAEDRLAAISRVTAADVANVAIKYVIARRSVTGWLSRKLRGKNAARAVAPAAWRWVR